MDRGVSIIDGDICIVLNDGDAKRLLIILDEFVDNNRIRLTDPTIHHTETALIACADDLATQLHNLGINPNEEL